MEWTVVGVIVVLIGLVTAIVKPLLAWNANLVLNTEAIKTLTAAMQSNERRNERAHCEIWDELDEHDKRISKIEHEGGGQ